jgi:outer membrane protein assembly factor BamB
MPAPDDEGLLAHAPSAPPPPKPLGVLRPLAGAVALLAAGACGGGQTRGSPFDPGWVDDHGAAMTRVASQLQSARVPLGDDVAVGVVGKRGLVGVPLDGGKRWSFAHVLHGRPALAGSVVVAAGGGEIFALEARTGKLLWSRTSGGRIRGAGDDGVTTVVSILPTTGYGSVVLAVARDGSVVRQLEDDGAIGVPAVAGDSVFLPWQGHFLSVYDLPSGDERARLAFPDRVSRAMALGGVVFAGEATFTRLDERVHLAMARSATTAAFPAPLGGLPGDPAWTRPGTDWVNREADAQDKIRLYARPTASGPAGIDGGRLAVTWFRIVLGVDAASGRLVWARAHSADFLGGAAYRGGFALCDASGTVTFLDARTGGVAGNVSLGRPVHACLVQADAFSLPAAPAAGSVSEQLTEVLRLEAPDLAPFRPVLAREMAMLARRPAPD